eukprot:1768043-Rhodomonas_salina.2
MIRFLPRRFASSACQSYQPCTSQYQRERTCTAPGEMQCNDPTVGTIRTCPMALLILCAPGSSSSSSRRKTPHQYLSSGSQYQRSA